MTSISERAIIAELRRRFPAAEPWHHPEGTIVRFEPGTAHAGCLGIVVQAGRHAARVAGIGAERGEFLATDVHPAEVTRVEPAPAWSAEAREREAAARAKADADLSDALARLAP
jgi:hypothetical protein